MTYAINYYVAVTTKDETHLFQNPFRNGILRQQHCNAVLQIQQVHRSVLCIEIGPTRIILVHFDLHILDMNVHGIISGRIIGQQDLYRNISVVLAAGEEHG